MGCAAWCGASLGLAGDGEPLETAHRRRAQPFAAAQATEALQVEWGSGGECWALAYDVRRRPVGSARQPSAGAFKEHHDGVFGWGSVSDSRDMDPAWGRRVCLRG